MTADTIIAIRAGLLSLGMLAGVPVAASVCADPGQLSFVAASVVNHERSELADGLAASDQLTQELGLVAKASAHWSFGLRHRYSKFGFTGIDPQTNGHLHRTEFAVHWWQRARRTGLRVAAAPSLSASSNVLGDPGRYRRDTLQLPVAIVWTRQPSKGVNIRYGLCGDDQFGRYRFYPTSAAEWRPHPDLVLELGYPASSAAWRINSTFNTGLRAAPDGSEWHVMDRAFASESRFEYMSYLVEWWLELEAGSNLGLRAGAGRQLRNRFEMTLQNGDRISIEAGDTNRYSLQVRWRF